MPETSEIQNETWEVENARLKQENQSLRTEIDELKRQIAVMKEQEINMALLYKGAQPTEEGRRFHAKYVNQINQKFNQR